MMNKRVFYFCCLALPALWLTACEQGSDGDSEHGELVPLSVNELTLTGEVVTRVPEGPVTTDGAAISVFQLAFSGYMPAYNRTYTYSAAAGGWSSVTPVCVDDRVSKIVGVYDPNGIAFPASNTNLMPATNLTAQVYDETKVWYYDNSHTAVKNTTAAIAFTMTPVYSRISLQIRRDASYLGDCKITEVTLSSGGVFFNELPFDIASGALQGSATAYNGATKPLLIKADGLLTIPSGTTAAQDLDLLLPPQTIQSAGLLLSLKIDDLVRSVTIPYASLPKLASAMQYTVPLKIVGPATLILNGNVTDGGWNTASSVGSITDQSGLNKE